MQDESQAERSAAAEEAARAGVPAAPPASPKKSAPRKSSADRRVQILAELAGLLSMPGSPKASTSELARRVGVTEPALYRHFSGKAQMLDALLDQAAEAVDAIQGSGVQAALAAMEILESRPAMARLLAGDGLCGEEPRLAARAEAVWAKIEAKVGGAPDSAQAVCDWMRGSARRWLAGDRKDSAARTASAVYALERLC